MAIATNLELKVQGPNLQTKDKAAILDLQAKAKAANLEPMTQGPNLLLTKDQVANLKPAGMQSRP